MIKQEGLNKEDKQFATKVMVWYLVNLLLLPVIGFVMQVILYRGVSSAGDLHGYRKAYAKVALIASCVGGSLILVVCSLFFLLLSDPLKAWPLIIVYFTVMHSMFILWGILNLARALASRPIAPFGFAVSL